MLKARSLKKAAVPATLIHHPSPANLHSNRLSLHVSQHGTSCCLYVASACHVYRILISLEDSLVNEGKDSLLIPEQTQVVDSAIVNRCPHRSEIQTLLLNETESSDCLILGSVDSYGHLIVSKMDSDGKGRSTTEAMHIIRRIMEKYREKKRDLHMVFIDLEKAYDSVPRQLILESLRLRKVPEKYIKIIRDMYEGVKTCVRAPVGDTDFFPVEVGLHQGSALSPFLFTIVLDEMTKSIQEPVPWCMLFADDIVLISESKTVLNERLEQWRTALECRGLTISRSKTEYMHCNFSGEAEEDTQISIQGMTVPQTSRFKYLGSYVQEDGEIHSDVAHRVQSGWCKWRAASWILCDRRFPTKLKGKLYRVAVRPAMLYGKDCWAIKKWHQRQIEVAEMRMLRWMCGHTRLDRIRNDVFRQRLQVACITDKIREGRLRWFGHVKRRSMVASVRAVENINVEGRRSRGRPRLTWDNIIRRDMIDLHLSEHMIEDRSEWRRRIKIKDF